MKANASPTESCTFSALVRRETGLAEGYTEHFIPVPTPHAERLVCAGHARIRGRIGTVPYASVLQRRSDGAWCVRLDGAWVRRAGLEPGDLVGVTMGPDVEGQLQRSVG